MEQQPTLLRRNRDFLLLWVSQAASVLGSQISFIAYPLLVLALTDSATKAGLVATAASLPALLLYLHAGVLVDRFDRKRIMLVSDAVNALSAASLGAAVLLDRVAFAHILAVAFIHGTGFVVFSLAELAALPRVVLPTQVSEAIARNESRTYAALLIGPPIGGALFAVGRAAPFLVDAVSYALSFGLVSRVKTTLQEQRERATSRMRDEIVEGISWLWSRPFLRYSVFLVAGLNLIVNSVALLVIIHARQEGVHPSLIGVLFASFGVGGLLGSLAAPRLQRRLHTRVVVLGILWLDAVLVLLLAPTANPLIVIPVFTALAFFGPTWNAVVTGYRVAIVPDPLQGRVNSAARVVAIGAMPLGYAIGGFAVDTVGSSASILGFGLAMAMLAAVATLIPSVRRVQDLKALLAERELQTIGTP
jgi:predicted MFS family arabinose efflux permease